jgi:DNA-binding transcriptional regulator YhcF (GntR family)
MTTLDPRVVVAVIAWFHEKLGYAPTVRELAIELGCSVSTVHKALARLERQGRIIREPGKARTIRINEAPPLAAGGATA